MATSRSPGLVLALGASGLLGKTLCPELEKSGLPLKRHNGRSDPAPIDFSRHADVFNYLDKVRPSVIVNLIALANVDGCEKDPASADLNNVKPAETVAAWVLRNPATHMIQISTDMVYDGDGTTAPKSENETSLVNYYAYSKFCADLIVERVGGTVLRTNFFGRGRAAAKTSFSDWLLAAASAGKPVDVFKDAFFSPLLMETLSAAVATAVSKRIPGIFNLGSREGMSKFAFAQEIARVFDLPESSFRPGLLTDARLAARRPRDMRMNVDVFEKRFGFELPTLKEEILKLRSLT